MTRVDQQQEGHIGPHFLPDGQRFLFYARGAPNTTGGLPGRARRHRPDPPDGREISGAFSPDGRWVAYMSNESGPQEIYVRPFVPPSRDASIFASATADKSADTLRPGSGQAPGAASTAAAAGGQWQVSTAGGAFPVWRRDTVAHEEIVFVETERPNLG